MILIDDPKGLTIEKAFDMAKAEGIEPLYDTDLMLGSGTSGAHSFLTVQPLRNLS